MDENTGVEQEGDDTALENADEDKLLKSLDLCELESSLLEVKKILMVLSDLVSCILEN